MSFEELEVFCLPHTSFVLPSFALLSCPPFSSLPHRIDLNCRIVITRAGCFPDMFSGHTVVRRRDFECSLELKLELELELKLRSGRSFAGSRNESSHRSTSTTLPQSTSANSSRTTPKQPQSSSTGQYTSSFHQLLAESFQNFISTAKPHHQKHGFSGSQSVRATDRRSHTTTTTIAHATFISRTR